MQGRIPFCGVKLAQPPPFWERQNSHVIAPHDVVGFMGLAPPPSGILRVRPLGRTVAVEAGVVMEKPAFHEQHGFRSGDALCVHELPGWAELACSQLVDELVHFACEGVMAAGGTDPIGPCGAVLCGEVEFAGHFHVQRAAALDIFYQEIKFAYGALLALKLNAVCAQAKMRAGFKPKCNQGFEMLAQQLSARL